MEMFTENKDYVLAISIPLTVLFVIASMLYTIRNISRTSGKSEAEKDKTTINNSKTDQKLEKESNNSDERDVKVDSNIDPVQYCEHIQSEVKKARHKVATQGIREKLTEEDLRNEKEIQRKQIEDIFKLMEQHSDKFGVSSEDDVRQQMKLYV